MNLKEEAANTNWIALILLVLIVGGLAFGIYWWQKQNTIETTLPEITPTANPTVSPTATNTPSTTPAETDETAGWKIYENKTIGFSIKYPANWIYKDDYKTKDFFVAFGSEESDIPPPDTDMPAGISIGVRGKIKDSDRTNDVSKMKKEKIRINSIEADKITLLPGRKDEFLGESKIVSIEISLDNKKVIVLENVDSYEEEIFNKMIETFKFTD